MSVKNAFDFFIEASSQKRKGKNRILYLCQKRALLASCEPSIRAVREVQEISFVSMRARSDNTPHYNRVFVCDTDCSVFMFLFRSAIS
jgi:hypothetical protein